MNLVGVWRRGWMVTGITVVVALALRFHGLVPNTANLGSLLETFLPWLGLAAVPLAVASAVRRSAPAAIAVVVLLLVWTSMFASTLWPKGTGGGDLRVLTHNVQAGNTQPAATARDVLAAHADLVGLEEVTDASRPIYDDALASTYPYRATSSTVGLWSKYPITSYQPMDLGLSWARALRAVVAAPHGTLAVYVVHLASVRVGASGFTSSQRDRAIAQLSSAVRADPESRVLVMGDLNGSSYDRALNPLTDEVRSVQRQVGTGFGFTWPAQFPMARIDQILYRGMTPTRAWVLARTGSDHRPTAAEFVE